MNMKHILTLLTALLAPLAVSQAADRVLVGAIRWDAWVGDQGPSNPCQHGVWNEQALASDKRWHNGIPFYGKVLPDGKVEARLTDQQGMDQEIAYAKGAIDYWAFWDSPEWGKDAPMHTALKLYLSSAHKGDIKFAIMLNNFPWSRHLAEYLQYLREPSYQKVHGDRPLIYLFIGSDRAPGDGETKELRQSLTALRERSIAQGSGKPYYVIMHFQPADAAQFCDLLGGDAISSYARPRKGAGEPYLSLVKTTEQSWDKYKGTGKQVIPTCMTGWDQRPRTLDCGNPNWKKIRQTGPGWFQTASPAEVAQHLSDAARWLRAHPDNINSMICYAWNEFTEGGWLCPALGDGDARLKTIREYRVKQAW